MPGRLIMINKRPGDCPVGIRETSWCLWDKWLLRVMRPKSTNACQDYHLCFSLKSLINEVVYMVQAIWDAILSTYYWGFILVDAKNAFNKIIWIGMLLTVRHLWLTGDRLFLTIIITGHILSWVTGTLRPVFCMLERVWRRGGQFIW